jgi:hypothetical protein
MSMHASNSIDQAPIRPPPVPEKSGLPLTSTKAAVQIHPLPVWLVGTSRTKSVSGRKK